MESGVYNRRVSCGRVWLRQTSVPSILSLLSYTSSRYIELVTKLPQVTYSPHAIPKTSASSISQAQCRLHRLPPLAAPPSPHPEASLLKMLSNSTASWQPSRSPSRAGRRSSSVRAMTMTTTTTLQVVCVVAHTCIASLRMRHDWKALSVDTMTDVGRCRGYRHFRRWM